MIRFPIDFKLSTQTSEFHLNDEWTVQYQVFLNEFSKNLSVNCSLVTRKDIIYDEVLISGELSITKCNKTVLKTSEFSKLMMGSGYMRFLQLCPENSYKSSFLEELNLRGFIIIIVCNSDNCIEAKSLVQLSYDFKQLLDQQPSSFADVNLICGDVSFPAHKVILCARSPVFAAMFKNPMKERDASEVNITDIDGSILRILMIYIYTGKVSDLTNTLATDLLVAADKYMMQDLKEVCSDFLKNSATLQYILATLVSWGDILPECLKSVAMDYISTKCKNFSLIENEKEWKVLKEQSPAFVIEVLESLLKSRDTK